jgi:tetratricopeptide (TPR) repeat protein
MRRATQQSEILTSVRGVVLCSAVVLTPLVSARELPSAVDVPKATILWATGLLLAVLNLVPFTLKHRGRPSAGAPVVRWAAIGFGVALVVTSAASPERWTSIVGYYPRHTGLLFYLALLAVWWAASDLDVRWRRRCTATVVGTAGIVLVYGALQWAGVPQFQWNADFSGVYATLGQSNFLSAYLAVVTPLALVTARVASTWLLRGAAVAAASGALPLLAATRSTQGVAALASALVVMLFAHLAMRRDTRPRMRAEAVRWGVSSLGLAAAGAGAVAIGWPRLLQGGLLERRYIYEAAASMIDGHLLLGRGLDLFGIYFLRFRPLEHAQLTRTATVDAAHSVPIHLATGGGAVLLAAYAVFALATAYLLIRLVWGSQRGDVEVLGLVGSWTAYQVQSLVSIENAPVAVLHYLVAGMAVSVWRQRATASDGVQDTAKRSVRGSRSERIRSPLWARVSAGIAAVVLLAVGSALTTRPIRAELATAAAAEAAERGDLGGAVRHLESAHRLAPGVGDYYLVHSRLLQQAGAREAAYDAIVRGADNDPGYSSYPATAAVLAESLNRSRDAERWFDRALEIDPFNPEVLAESARFYFERGDAERATRLQERLAEVNAA